MAVETMLDRIKRDTARAASPDEARWFQRLKRVVADMPRGIEIVVGPRGDVRMHERGARDATFDLHGCADRTPEMDSFLGKRISGEESSL